ncbi:hypothetical protein C4552_01825 [Candidatus Parcubacteria bacterium]|nr:MAG: hypothetical protein C4552_01825 [Candidatus Parcubacteria bacterium]
MFIAFLAAFLIYLAIDAALSAAALYHLRQYTMPDWQAARLIVPIYLALATLFALLALYELWNIPFADFGTSFDLRQFLPPAR